MSHKTRTNETVCGPGCVVACMCDTHSFAILFQILWSIFGQAVDHSHWRRFALPPVFNGLVFPNIWTCPEHHKQKFLSAIPRAVTTITLFLGPRVLRVFLDTCVSILKSVEQKKLDNILVVLVGDQEWNCENCFIAFKLCSS